MSASDVPTAGATRQQATSGTSKMESDPLNSDRDPTARFAERDSVSGRSLGEIGLQQFAPYLMNRIMGRYNHTIRDKLNDEGLTTPKMRTLAVLSVIDGLKINELAVYTITQQPTLSRALDAMEADGLVRRVAATDDNRVRNIFITERGREIFNAVWPTMLGAAETMFVGIDDGERERFVGTLQKILRNIRKHDF